MLVDIRVRGFALAVTTISCIIDESEAPGAGSPAEDFASEGELGGVEGVAAFCAWAFAAQRTEAADANRTHFLEMWRISDSPLALVWRELLSPNKTPHNRLQGRNAIDCGISPNVSDEQLEIPISLHRSRPTPLGGSTGDKQPGLCRHAS
jgi:hypothetical protein